MTSAEVLRQPSPGRVPGLFSWQTVAVSRGGRQVLFLVQVVFRGSQLQMLRAMWVRRSAPASFHTVSPHFPVHPDSLVVSRGAGPARCSREVAISMFLLVFALRQFHLELVLVLQISVRLPVRFWMVLAMELHTLRQCGVRASMVRVSGRELPVHFRRGLSLHCRADRGLHDGFKRTWPLSQGERAMSARARCLPCWQRGS